MTRPDSNHDRPDPIHILDTLRSGYSERQTAERLNISRYAVRQAKRSARDLPALEDGTQVSDLRGSVGLTVARGGGTPKVDRSRQIGDTYAQAGVKSTSKFVGFVAPEGGPMGQDWKASVFTDADIEHMSANQLFSLLLSASPEVSKGAHDFVRLFNPGNEIHAYTPGTEDIHEEGEAYLGEVIYRIKQHYVSVNVIFARMAMSLFSRGAILAESVLDDAGREFVDLVVADPAAVAFKRVDDPERGFYWQLGQWQGTKWVSLESELIAYVPFDPQPDSPYGRAPMMPALFPALFLMGFLQDLRRVVANAGYNRIALSVDVPALLATAKEMSRNGQISKQDFLAFLRDVKRAMGDEFRSLNPGDALVKDSNIVVENLAGTLSTINPAGLEGIVTALERMCVKALKSIPLLHGITESTSDANANRQWEMLVASIKDMQHLAEDLLSRLLGTILQARGILADVKVEFAELRAAEMHRDEMTHQLQIDNAEHLMTLGFLTPSEAAMDAAGFVSDAVAETYEDPDKNAGKKDAPVPPTAPPPGNGDEVPQAEDLNPDPSEDRVARKIRNRRRKLAEHRAVSTTTTVSGFDEEEASRVFDEMIPVLAGILEATPEEEEVA